MGIIKNLRKLGVKGFLKKWKQGIMRLTPEQLLRSELQGYIGSILGTFLAGIIFLFVYDRMWPIAIILLFSIVIQSSQAIGKWQQLSAIKKMKEHIESFEELMEGNEDDR